MVKLIVAKEKHDCEHLLGTFVDERHFDLVVEEDTDCYMEPLPSVTGMSNTDERRIAFKFRKNYFSKEEQMQAYEGLREAAIESQNRGHAAGPRGEILGDYDGRSHREWVTDYQLEILDFLITDGTRLVDDVSIESIREKYNDPKLKSKVDETRGNVWLRSKVIKEYPEYTGWFDQWVDGLHNKPKDVIREEANKIANEWISDTTYAQAVLSGIAGWFDRYPRIPYGRATAYTERNPDKFAKSYPFLQSLNKGFKDLLPWRHENQQQAANKIDSRFLVPGTVFTTITVNKSFRTACHRDAGDLNEGLSNLLVLGDGRYKGGYLVFPEYRIAVNVRPGDLLLVNNHEIIHANTEIVLDDDTAERISLVCYFREKMLELKSWEYEQLRKAFIDQRRLNENHPLWRPLWNGVSPQWDTSEEWYDFLKKNNMPNPYPVEEKASLLGFFE